MWTGTKWTAKKLMDALRNDLVLFISIEFLICKLILFFFSFFFSVSFELKFHCIAFFKQIGPNWGGFFVGFFLWWTLKRRG